MKKFFVRILFALCLCVGVLALSSCTTCNPNAEYEIYVEGYTLQIEEDGSYSIIGIPNEVASSTKWRVPEEIGGYPITHLGSYMRETLWYDTPDTLYDFGRVRWLILPACIETVCVSSDLHGVKIIETEEPLSKIHFTNCAPDEEETYFLSPYEATQNWRYLTEENFVENMVIVKNPTGDSASLLAAFGNGILEIPDEYDGLPITKIANGACCAETFDLVKLGAHVTEIGDRAFSKLPLSHFDFIEGITKIGASAFFETNLTSAVFPSTLTTLGEGAFWSSQLQSFDLSKTSLTVIPESAFRFCPLEGELQFPTTLNRIEDYAFYGVNFEEVVLPSSVERLYPNSFALCNRLLSFRLPDGVTSFSWDVIANCEEIRTIDLNKIEQYNQSSSSYGSFQTLKSISVAEDNGYFASENGILYSKDKKILYKCPAGLSMQSILIESESIAYQAFYGNPYLKEVYMAQTCNAIGGGAFHGCTALESVQLSDAIRILHSGTFASCSSLKIINTGKVEEFGAGCFEFCSSLQSVDLSACVEIRGSAFAYCDLRSVTLGSNCRSVGWRAFAYNKNLERFKRNALVEIDENAFTGSPVGDRKLSAANIVKLFTGIFRGVFPFVY